MKRDRIPETIAEIEEDLFSLESVCNSINETYKIFPDNEQQKIIYKESLALKLHNYYTVCERVFEKIAVDLNGGVPDKYDWHRRLLHSMTLEIKDRRPKVISIETEKMLSEYLGFRHVVRNIYGYELDFERMSHLIDKLSPTNLRFTEEINTFIKFLKTLSS